MSEKRIGLIPCQGTSNVGMITNKVAVNVTDNEKVNMVCPLGLPLGIKSMVDKVNGYDHHIALNGCPMRCASKALEAAGVTEYEEIIVTSDFDIKKSKDMRDETGMDLVEAKVSELIEKV